MQNYALMSLNLLYHAWIGLYDQTACRVRKLSDSSDSLLEWKVKINNGMFFMNQQEVESGAAPVVSD